VKDIQSIASPPNDSDEDSDETSPPERLPPADIRLARDALWLVESSTNDSAQSARQCEDVYLSLTKRKIIVTRRVERFFEHRVVAPTKEFGVIVHQVRGRARTVDRRRAGEPHA
jgi:hypothetical protein